MRREEQKLLGNGNKKGFLFVKKINEQPVEVLYVTVTIIYQGRLSY